MSEVLEITTDTEIVQQPIVENQVEQVAQPQFDQAKYDAHIDTMMEFATAEQGERDDKLLHLTTENNTDENLEVELDDKKTTEENNPFTQHGFNTQEELLADYISLKEKVNTPTQAEYEYPDEHSKGIANAILNKDYKALKNYAEMQLLASEVDTMQEDDKLKRFIQMQNPKFDNDLIEDEYTEQYTIDEELLEYNPIELRKAKLRLEQKRENDLAKANDYFKEQAKKAQLPSISVSSSQAQADEQYNSYLASNAQAEKYYVEVIEPSINALTEDNLKMAVELNDPNSQIDVKFNIKPSKAHLDAAKEKAIHWDNYLRETVYDKDGNFLADKAALLVLKNDYFGEYAKTVARQSINAERINKVNEKRNVGFRTENVSQFQNNPMDYVDKMMQQRLS